MISKNLQLVSTSNLDDASFWALKDICDLTADQNIRVVGGQMIEMMRTAFPTPGLSVRSTIDADAAIETEFAASGNVHELLTNAGYEATHGNSYKKDRQKIDLLVGNMLGKFKTEIFGERAFDSAPGIQLALDAAPLNFNVQALLKDGTSLEFVARTPSVELAVCIKSLSYQSRLSEQDMVDLYYLLKIVNNHEIDQLGGWRLDQPAKANRLHSQRALQTLSQNLNRPNKPISVDIDRAEFIALLAKWVAKP